MTHKISFLYPLSLTISFSKVLILLHTLWIASYGEGGGPQENTCIYTLEYVHESVDMNVNVGVTMCLYAWGCV